MNTLRDYYTEMGVDIDTLLQINRELRIGDLTLEQMIEKSTKIKREMMREAEMSTVNHNWTQKIIEKDSRKESPSTSENGQVNSSYTILKVTWLLV